MPLLYLFQLFAVVLIYQAIPSFVVGQSSAKKKSKHVQTIAINRFQVENLQSSRALLIFNMPSINVLLYRLHLLYTHNEKAAF